MEHMSNTNGHFASGNTLYPDTHAFNNTYDNAFSGNESSESSQLNDSQNWNINPVNFPNQSRAHASPANWQQTSVPYNGSHTPAYGQGAGDQNPTPYTQASFQQYANQQNYRQYRQPQYDPALVRSNNAVQQAFTQATNAFNQQQNAQTTIAPQALNNEYKAGNTVSQDNRSSLPPSAGSGLRVPASNLAAAIPKSVPAGIFQIVDFDGLAKSTRSERMNNFANISLDIFDWDCHQTAIPTYVPRKSRNQQKAQAGNNPILLAKLNKKSTKSRVLPNNTLNPVRPSPATKAGQAITGIKYEGETSEDETSSSDDDSDDDSAYSDEDDTTDSPLPATRPDTPREAVEYDTIKALWRSKRKTIDGEVIRQGLDDFWKVVKVIRDRWKADQAAVVDAEEKKRVGDLALLKSRVKDQRDMIEIAFKTALKHGNRRIVELMAENVPFLFLCYQFLLDRLKEDDVNGPLSRAILETMSMFTTITDAKMEKTHLVKILPRVQKKCDAKTSYWLKKILSSVGSDSKTTTTKNPAPADETKVTASVNGPKIEDGSKRPATEPVAGVKRAASGTSDGNAAKKVAGPVRNAAAAIKTSDTIKKPLAATTANKAAVPAPGPAAVKKTVVAKPSGFFSSLQSAAKKPGTSNADKAAALTKPATISATSATNGGSTASASSKPAFSFADAMANLAKPKEEKPVVKTQKEAPTESAEQKAKRLRKESRRSLNVRFKQDEDLVQIRYFVHDPEEETHNDASQVRDVADVGGEGRMFKQQHRLDAMDEEDEPLEEMQPLLDFKTPSWIDFSVVDKEERARNFAPYGGGQNQPDSAERAAREKHEADTLMVFYSDPSQIPPNPREPADPYNGVQGPALSYFGQPEDKYVNRARTRKQSNGQFASFQPAHTQPAMSFPNMSSGSAPAMPMPDIRSILDKLQQSNAMSAQPPAPAFVPPPIAFNPPAAPVFAPPSAAPAANGSNIDLAAILASLQGNGAANNATVSSIQSFPAFNIAALTAAATATPTYQPSMLGSNTDDSDGKDDSSKHPFYKTKVCKFWHLGRCTKGDACSYLHD